MQTFKLFILIFILFISNYIFSQNLVLNPSFEENTGIPDDRDGMLFLKYWEKVKVNPYYMHEDADSTLWFSCNTAKNYFGSQEPHSGKAYVALELVDIDAIETATLIQGFLTKPLIAGRTYYAEYYLSLSDNSTNATSDFYIFFSDTAYNKKMKNAVFQKLTPQLSNPINNFITDKDGWTKISGTFKARGGEKYMMMGNHTKKATLLYPDLIESVVYYLDDFLIKEIYDLSDTTEKNTNRVLKNLTFETDKSVILEASFEELNYLCNILKMNKTYKIEILGHTDNVGSKEYNQKLSEDRAIAVADYLILHGIEKERITSIGYGSSNPITDNLTESGRAKNRRVEFILK